MIIKLNFQFQIGRWSIQLGNDYGSTRIILWKHRYSDYTSGSFARWQWDFRKWPVTMKEQEVPVIECVGMGFVPVEYKPLPMPDDYWPDTVE
jgi:hypothetical protein